MLEAPPPPLLVDLVAAPAPDESDLHNWMADQRVFLSSVMAGMGAERRAAADAVASVGAIPVWFEEFGGRDDDPEGAYLAEVARSDIYVGILGERYGIPLPSGYSATHAEYDEAERRGLRMSVWVTSGAMDGRQQDFRDTARVFHTTGGYTTPADLEERIALRLREIGAEALAPRIKVGHTVVRASELQDDGTTLKATARVRDRSAIAALEALRPAPYGGRSQVRVTWPGGAALVEITEVRTALGRSGRAPDISIVGNRVEERRSSLSEVAVDGRAPEDLTELALRISLFDEPNPLGMMASLVEGQNPLPQLAGLHLGEDAYREVAELLIAEELLLRPGIDHITSLQIGSAISGQRPLRLGWMPRRRYVNVNPEPRSIEGAVRC